MELTPRSTVGRDADVPRNRRESDTAGNIARARAPGGRRAGPRYRHDQRKARNNRTPGKSNAAAIRALSFGPAYVGSRPKRLRCQLNQQGLGCSKDLLDYSATKGAIHALTESLAQNLVEKGIAPAYVFFASNGDSSFVTGEVLALLGGETTAA